jgi:hypothetical protein
MNLYVVQNERYMRRFLEKRSVLVAVEEATHASQRHSGLPVL